MIWPGKDVQQKNKCMFESQEKVLQQSYKFEIIIYGQKLNLWEWVIESRPQLEHEAFQCLIIKAK